MSYWGSNVTSIVGVSLLIAGAIIVLYVAAGPKLQMVGASFVILGAILGAVGAVLFSIDSSRQQESLRLKSEAIANLNMKIAELNEQIAGSVTGGDSFCYLFPSPSFGSLNTIDFHLHHKGEYPVYDVSIRVWDESCLERIDHGQISEKYLGYRTKEMTYEEWLKMKEDHEFIVKNKGLENEIKERMRSCLLFQERLGTITPNTSTNIMDSSLFSCTVPHGGDLSKFSQEYGVNIVARNGQYNQKIVLDVRNKRYHVYSKVEKVISSSQRVVVREYESQDSEGFVIKLLK